MEEQEEEGSAGLAHTGRRGGMAAEPPHAAAEQRTWARRCASAAARSFSAWARAAASRASCVGAGGTEGEAGAQVVRGRRVLCEQPPTARAGCMHARVRSAAGRARQLLSHRGALLQAGGVGRRLLHHNLRLLHLQWGRRQLRGGGRCGQAWLSRFQQARGEGLEPGLGRAARGRPGRRQACRQISGSSGAEKERGARACPPCGGPPPRAGPRRRGAPRPPGPAPRRGARPRPSLLWEEGSNVGAAEEESRGEGRVGRGVSWGPGARCKLSQGRPAPRLRSAQAARRRAPSSACASCSRAALASSARCAALSAFST